MSAAQSPLFTEYMYILSSYYAFLLPSGKSWQATIHTFDALLDNILFVPPNLAMDELIISISEEGLVEHKLQLLHYTQHP